MSSCYIDSSQFLNFQCAGTVVSVFQPFHQSCGAALVAVEGQEENPAGRETAGQAGLRMPLFFRKRKPSEDSQKRLEYQLCRVKTVFLCYDAFHLTSSHHLTAFCVVMRLFSLFIKNASPPSVELIQFFNIIYFCCLRERISVPNKPNVCYSLFSSPRRPALMISWTSQLVS